jgi:hypothetical protein
MVDPRYDEATPERHYPLDKIRKADGSDASFLAELAIVLSHSTQFAFIKSVTTAPSAGGINVIDSVMAWAVNIWKARDAMVVVEVGGIHYTQEISSNDATSLTFPAIGVAIPTGSAYAIISNFGSIDLASIVGTALTADDWTLRFQALNDDSVKGLLKSIGDIGAGTNLNNRIGELADAAKIDYTDSGSAITFIKGLLRILQDETTKGLLKSFGDIAAGDNFIARLGAKADVAIIDPTVDGSVIAYLKGILTLLETQPKKASASTLYNVTKLASEEGSQLLPDHTKSFNIKLAGGLPGDIFYTAWETGKVATPTSPYDRHDGSMGYSEMDKDLVGKTIYFATPKVGGGLFIVEAWV